MGKWVDTRWWMVVDSAGDIWCQTSSVDEALDELDSCPAQPATLKRYQTKTKHRWVLTDPGSVR